MQSVPGQSADGTLPVADWDWRAIAALETKARARARALPRCSRCRLPLMVGQVGQHRTCQTGSTSTDTQLH
jgi:hypothetical protein